MSNKKPRVLVIDDTPANLLMLGAALTGDFDLQIATSGAMGLVLASASPPDLILLDVMMPEMDGFETCSRLKAEPSLKNVPIIFVTALRERDTELKGLASGAADYITKPINVEIARQRICNLLERERLRKEVEAQLAERQRIQLALQESEQRFRHFFEKNSSVMLLIDPSSGVIDAANEAAATYYGYTKARLAGMHISDINVLPPEWSNEERQLALHEEHNYSFFPHRLASGEMRDVEVHSTPIETGGRPMLFSIVHDITERKQAEQALQESYEALSSILDTTLDGFWWTDLQGNLLDVNRTYCRQSGYSREELLEMQIANLDAMESTSFVAERIHHLIVYGRELFETKHRRKDGSFWHVEVSTTYHDVSGGQIFVFLRDITERKQLEKAREEVLSRLNKIASRVPGVVFQYRLRPDGSSCFPFASEAIRAIYRVSPEEVREDAAKVLANVHPDDEEDIAISIQKSAQYLTPWRHEYRVKFDDGTVRWLFGNALPQREADGGTLWHGFITDITEHKQAEAELDEHRHHLEELVQVRTMALSIAKEAAESANRAKSTFLANMSHELRTPMNHIMGLSSLALRRSTDPKLTDQLTKVTQASQRLLSVINDILDISKIEAERLSLEKITFKLGSVLENLSSLFGQKAAQQGLKLQIELSPELANQPLQGDPLRLEQILLNLTGNAIKFTSAGSVTVRVLLAAEGPDDLLLRFEVSDTGIGISTEAQSRLFTAFEQADGSLTRKYGGTGLGLAISKRLVEMMGGSIGVDSQEGVGSVFWCTIRLKKTEQMGPALEKTGLSAEEELKSRYSGTPILLVEDEPINQEVSRGLLEEVGLRVHVAADGVEALEMAKRMDYQLILMDMQMPRMNGIEATRAIRALPHRKTRPIVALTANAFNEDRRACEAAGMNDFVSKPVDPNLLYTIVLKWLSGAVS